MEQRTIKVAKLSDDRCPFIDWLDSLDKTTKSRVQSRLTCLLENNFGYDTIVASSGNDVIKLAEFCGATYAKNGNDLILMPQNGLGVSYYSLTLKDYYLGGFENFKVKTHIVMVVQAHSRANIQWNSSLIMWLKTLTHLLQKEQTETI